MLNILARGMGRLRTLDITKSLRFNGVEFGGAAVGPVSIASVLFIENGAGTYTGTIPLPAGARIIDIGVHALALWTAATSAAMVVGDTGSANGFFLSTNLKATDLLVDEINNIEHPGGLAGAYIAAEQRKLFSATARNVIGVVTSVGAGVAGRTRMYVVYGIPPVVNAVQT